MNNPKIKTKVLHSESKSAWNVLGTTFGGKHKVAQVPYFSSEDAHLLTEISSKEAKNLAEFISHCFNNSDYIISKNLPNT